MEILNVLLPLTIGIIMFGIGLNLKATDFKRLLKAPKAILVGLFGQMALLPLISFGIASLFDMEPIYKLGIILIAICPGGTSSNIVTYLLKGRIELSVSITAFNSLFIILTIPILLKLAFNVFLDSDIDVTLSILDTFLEVIYTVLIPVVGGIIVHHYYPKTVELLSKPLHYILPGLLFIIFLLVILNEKRNGETQLSTYSFLLIPTLFLNIVVMFVGFYFSKISGLDHRSNYTIAIEMGLQNSALAIFLANNILKMEDLSIIAVIYGSFSFFTTFLLGYLMREYTK